MRLRTRLVLAFAAVVLVPIVLLAFGIRHEMTGRLAAEHARRVDGVVAVIEEDLRRESDAIAARLSSLADALRRDNRFRLAAVAGVETESRYLLDYAETAMRLTGLSMLQVHDVDGRILSSGHFRNEHGRIDPGVPAALAEAGARITLVTARAADHELVALARVGTVEVGGRPFTLVGGVAVDQSFLARLTRDREVVVSLIYPGGGLSSAPERRGDGAAADGVMRDLPVTVITPAAPGEPPVVVPARIEVIHPATPLADVRRGIDRWFALTAAGTGVAALMLAVWVSARISRPLAALADKTAVLDLDRLDVEFDGGHDEVGTLSRLLGDLAARLRASAGRIREAERRATVGDLARQINHDIKNGLIPLRNVFRHLTEVERDDPTALAAVFAERRQTVDSSIAYLETLARNYARLSPHADVRACDLNGVVAEVVRGARELDHVEIQTRLAPRLPAVAGDPVALRRVLDNLLANAVDSLESRPGTVTLSTAVVDADGEPPAVRVTVADTGRGMRADETAMVFNDFYTTKAGGTGLGLSIVRRLVLDLSGRLEVDSAPGAGTRVIVEIPAAGAGATDRSGR